MNGDTVVCPKIGRALPFLDCRGCEDRTDLCRVIPADQQTLGGGA